jgi:hypothetical protein
MGKSEPTRNHQSLGEIEVIPYPRTVRYPATPDVCLPARPTSEGNGGGWFGFGGNRQDQAHLRRLHELHNLGVEVAYAEEMAVAIEVKGIKAVSDGVRQAENLVYSLPPETVAGMVAADLVSDMTARRRLRHNGLMEVNDAEAMNLIHRR